MMTEVSEENTANPREINNDEMSEKNYDDKVEMNTKERETDEDQQNSDKLDSVVKIDNNDDDIEVNNVGIPVKEINENTEFRKEEQTERNKTRDNSNAETQQTEEKQGEHDVVSTESETIEVNSKETDSCAKSTEENVETETTPEELQRKISESKLKSETLQNELDMTRAKNTELEEKIKALDDSRKKSSESMSSTEAREKAKQRDGLAFQADYLARELSQQQNTESYLRQKLTDTLEEKEDLERKNKDLQLRLKRFTKDDQVKDERIARMEKELNDINMEVQEMEKLVGESSMVKIYEMRQTRGSIALINGESIQQSGQTSADQEQSRSLPKSKMCTIL